MHIETMSRASLKSNSYGGLPWHTKAVLLRICNSKNMKVEKLIKHKNAAMKILDMKEIPVPFIKK